MENIGVVGLGRMGSAIARRMQAEGRNVIGWTRSGRPVEGIAMAPDIARVVTHSDTIILSLFDDTAVAEVLDMLLTLDLGGKQIIETSTVVPTVLRDRIGQIKATGATAVDAPISGGPELVLAGACGVFIGGDDAAATRAQTTLGAISNRIFHVGPLGAGLVMKTINNGMIQCYFNGLGDLMPLAKRAGLPMETAIQILMGGPAGMPMLKDRMPKILGEDPTVGFTVSAGHKDNQVFQRVVRSYGLESPMLVASGVRQRSAITAGLGEADPAALVRFAYEGD
ncbi:MAG: NAD(P)-dependent oxidoreductase [Yoonia sp.]|uniref:NAD(P)-dependent oxidoreductase n=1 Tax=Yoonia sp. TaxID=2212373 RepID=UPI00273E5D11|nr:NAD(P)-dependent oxidoreductase [Yoonia sp.]MDP5086289.1 NAD(P)-dependent oxidoreductase [Yoonia sp.]